MFVTNSWPIATSRYMCSHKGAMTCGEDVRSSFRDVLPRGIFRRSVSALGFVFFRRESEVIGRERNRRSSTASRMRYRRNMVALVAVISPPRFLIYISGLYPIDEESSRHYGRGLLCAYRLQTPAPRTSSSVFFNEMQPSSSALPTPLRSLQAGCRPNPSRIAKSGRAPQRSCALPPILVPSDIT